MRLTKALSAWGTSDFAQVLKAEIESLDAGQLQLQRGLSTGSYAVADKLGAMIISVAEASNCIRAKAGIFYSSIIAGCSCADDPTPVDQSYEYCVVQLDIDKATAETTVVVLAE